jgi:hypothetical protein
MKAEWIHKKTIVDGENYEINGLNIWDFNWEDTGDKINIKDPLYAQDYCFNIYKIQKNDNSIFFSAGEFSNCVWGIYEKSGIIYEDQNLKKSSLTNWLKKIFS